MILFENMRRWLVVQPAALWIVLLLALVLRLFQLTESGLWNDEAFSVRIATLPFWEMSAWIAQDGIHPPFFYLLLHPWILIFGDSEVAVRSLTVVTGVLTVFLIYAVAERLYSQRAGLVAAFFLATSSFYIFYSQDVRMYMFMAPPALVSFYALYRLSYDRRVFVYVVYFLSTVILLYTHIFGVFYVLAQNAYYLGLLLLGQENRPKLTHWIALQSATVLAFAPWLPFVFRKAQQQQDRGAFWLDAPDLDAVVLIFGSFVGSMVGLFIVCGVLLVAALFGTRRVWSSRRRLMTGDQFRKEGLLILWIFLPIIVTALYSVLVDPILYPRYVLPSAIPIFIVLAKVVMTWTGDSIRNAVIAGLVVVPLSAYHLFLYYDDDTRANHYRLPHDWRSATAYLAQNSDNNTLIVCAGRCHALDYYLRNEDLNKEMIPILRADAPNLERKISRLIQKIDGYEKIWFVTIKGRDPEGLARRTLEKDFRSTRNLDFEGLIDLELYKRLPQR